MIEYNNKIPLCLKLEYFSWGSLLVTQAEKWGFASHRKFRNASDPRAYSRTSSRFEAASISPSPKTGRNINPMYIYVPPSSSDVYLGGKITSQWICSFYRLESPSPFAWSGVRTLEEGGRRVFVMPGDDVGRSIKCTKHLLTTGNIYKTISKLQECCRQRWGEAVYVRTAKGWRYGYMRCMKSKFCLVFTDLYRQC